MRQPLWRQQQPNRQQFPETCDSEEAAALSGAAASYLGKLWGKAFLKAELYKRFSTCYNKIRSCSALVFFFGDHTPGERKLSLLVLGAGKCVAG